LDLAYAQVTLDEGKRTAFTAVYREIRRELSAPDLVIHLVCAPEVELERIRRRGRDVEQSITIDYLGAINRALAEVLLKEARTWNILTIDSAALDFANDEIDQKSVLEAVCSRLAQTANT
jgi:deoxyadenosine/deoxycytidine kinase